MDLQIMETNERPSEEGNSIFGLATSVSMEEDMSSPSLLASGGTMMTFRGRSKVWSEFFVTQDGKKVTCRRCGDSLAYSNSHSTSSMLKHLKRKHHMDLYPSAEEENFVPKLPRPPERPKKGSKATKRAPSPPLPEEQCIQHDPLEFNEACIRMRWTDHSDTFLRNFACMYDDEAYTDVTIVAEKHFFKAHRIILSSASEFFDETFKLTASGQHPVIFLKDTKALELRMLLDFIYRGEVSIPPNLIPSLVKIGGDMRVRGLCDFVWNESMVSTAFQGYSNESRTFVPRSNETTSTNLTPQSGSFCSNSTMSNRSLENLLRQQSDQQPPYYSQVGSSAARTVSSGEAQNRLESSSSNSVQPRISPGLTAKRNRVLPPTATGNESVATETETNSFEITSNPGEQIEESNLTMMTDDGQAVMSTPRVSLGVSSSSRCPQFTNTHVGVPIPINEGLHQHHDLGHVVKSQSQCDSEAMPDYSIRNVEVSSEQSENEVLLSDTGDGEHTIIVYGESEVVHTTLCSSDRKPF